jgi:rhodanese-related sulfurtransferase
MDKLPASISVQQAQTLRNEGAFILDVRSLAEWQAVHIPGSILIPLDQLESRLAEIPKDVKIVVVCRSGNRSAQGRSALLNAGFPLVTSMKGGMVSWQANGYDTISGN